MRKQKGITLIALVITIIVLLILAGVTISTLTGDNGLLQKAQIAGEQSKSAETEEQIKLIYAEYQISKYAEGNKSAGEYLKVELEKTYGEGNVDIIFQEEAIVLKVTVNGESKFYEYNPSTGISKQLQKGINYNGKQASEIVPGDDITIVTEKFKVFSTENNTIKAMPYYNLVIVTADGKVKQGPEVSRISTGIISPFSTAKYWEPGEDAIDMSDSRNEIQQYITAYETTLEVLGANIEVRAARYSDVNASGVTTTMRNPGRTGIFWLASDHSNDKWVKIVTGMGRI